MTEVAAVILAAGRATRFGAGDGTKAAALWRDRPLVRWVAEAALASRAADTIVVTGHAAEAVGAALEALPVRLVRNPHFASGMASSLQAGLAALPGSTQGAIILLADMPLITAALIDGLLARYEEAGAGADAVMPVLDGAPGHPVLLGRALFPAVAGLRGDEGARRLLATGRVLRYAVDDHAVALDIDTPDALRDLRLRP